MPLLDLFDRSLRGRAHRPGLDLGPGTETIRFGELEARSNRMAHALAARGLGPGDRLAVQLANGAEFVELFLACLKLGAVLVPVSVLYREREVGHILADAEPAALVSAAEHAPLAPPGARVWALRDLAAEAARASSRRPDLAFADAGTRTALIVYTSGTTGRPKGAVLTHGNLAANTLNLEAAWRITETDRYLAVLPLFHVHGLGNGMCSWLASGCLMRLVERFEHKRAAVLFEESRPTLFFGVPTIYVRLLGLPDRVARTIGAGMRLFVSGSAPLPASVFASFEGKFGHAILERYGMTETLMTLGNPYEGERRPGTVGRPFEGIEARIVDERGRVVSDSEIGELQVRGATVFAGYWRRPGATAEAFVDGWFRTGDLARRSPDGYFTLCGRSSDLIISGGFNIYPREIEDLLLEQPGVREAAVVGVDDVLHGEVPVAFVVGDFDPATLEAACREGLASFKVPRRFTRVESLPRNALGKVQKHLLRSS